MDVSLGLESLGKPVLDEEIEGPEHGRAAEERVVAPQ